MSSLRSLLFSPWLLVLLLFHAQGLNAQEQKEGTTEHNTQQFSSLIHKLRDVSLNQKAPVIDDLARLQDDRVARVLQALLDGKLFYTKNEEKRVVFIESVEAGYRITDVISKEIVGEVGKRKVKKIRINNKLRIILRRSLAQLHLNSGDPGIRLKAVTSLTQNLDNKVGDLLTRRLKIETDGDVKSAILMGLAFLDVNNVDPKIRLNAVQILSGNLAPEARVKLASLLKKNPDDSYAEKDQTVITAAEEALDSIRLKVSLYEVVETFFFGLSLGSVLALAAIGLAITFGVMGVINMAHGELIMLGAYTTYVVQLLMPNHIDISLFVAIPSALIVSALFGIAIERGIIRFLYGRPLETLLATFGVSLILQQMVRSIFSPLNRSVSTPAWMSGSLEVNGILSLTLNRLYIVAFTLVVFFTLLLILKKTRLGLEVRAVSQNRSMAKAMGIRSDWVDAMTFGLGSGVAGVAGVALSQLTNVGPNLGQAYIVDSFMVVVFGGVGNLWGTLIGGMSLGIANKIIEPFAGAVLAKILILIAIILFIQKRPRGLFPQKGRAAEN